MAFIDFTAGDVLTAAQMDTVVRQTVMSFANAAARTSALTAYLTEGMLTWLDDTDSLEVYTGSAWVEVPQSGLYLETAGGSMTGLLTLVSTNPTNAYHAAHKTYVDAEAASAASAAVAANEATRNADFIIGNSPEMRAASGSYNAVFRGGTAGTPIRPTQKNFDGTTVGETFVHQAPQFARQTGTVTLGGAGSFSTLTGTQIDFGTMPRDGYAHFSFTGDFATTASGLTTGQIAAETKVGGTWSVPTTQGASTAQFGVVTRTTCGGHGYVPFTGGAAFSVRLIGTRISGTTPIYSYNGTSLTAQVFM